MARRLALDKRAFFRYLGYEPHPGQMEVHMSSAPRRVLACGVRWGKSLCGAVEGLAAAMEPSERSIGWTVGPTYDLADKIYREQTYLCTRFLNHRIIAIKESERRILLQNFGGGVSEIRARSADNPVSLLGEGLSWVIVDEAARMRASIWESHISQRLIDKKGWALLISTPRGRGWFFGMWQRGNDPEDKAHACWNYPSWNNPHLDRALIEQERERLPARVFAQEYAGEFIEGAGQVFRGVRECAVGELAEPVPGARYRAGLDLARIEDFSVICMLDEERRVVALDRFNRIDWALQIERIRALLSKYNRAPVLVDSTGGGDPVLEALRRAGVDARPYKFTSASKAALVDNLSMMIEQRQIVLPRPELCPVLIDELEAYEYTLSDSGNVRMNAPAGQHDDTVVALALAAWKLRPGRPERRIAAGPIGAA